MKQYLQNFTYPNISDGTQKLPLVRSLRVKETWVNFLFSFLVFVGAMSIAPNTALGQTFTQVTTLAGLVDGDYLIVGDGSNDGLMINTITASTPYINYSAISNPGSSISSGYTSGNIFQVTVVSGVITIYNASVGYITWGRSGYT